MGFSTKIKEQIMVDTARHCCVCHRYKGVKVEVHHIEQEALGGKNTYENAIAVCFDCHADAGHYNPKHPRGTKFSPRELKKAKEIWVKIVQQNNIREPSEPDKFLCQYFVCESYENLVEISNGDLSRFPINNSILLKNNIFDALNNVITAHPKEYRYSNVCGEGYKSKEEYYKKYPASFITNGNDGKFSYFEFCRVPTLEELEKYKSKDGVLKLMMNHGMPIENISAIVGCYEDICCGVKVQEEFIFRKLWCSFLAITNISDYPVALDSVKGNVVIENKFSPFSCINSSKPKKGVNLKKVSGLEF